MDSVQKGPEKPALHNALRNIGFMNLGYLTY